MRTFFPADPKEGAFALRKADLMERPLLEAEGVGVRATFQRWLEVRGDWMKVSDSTMISLREGTRWGVL